MPPNAVYIKARACSLFRTAEFWSFLSTDDVIVNMVTSLLYDDVVIVLSLLGKMRSLLYDDISERKMTLCGKMMSLLAR